MAKKKPSRKSDPAKALAEDLEAATRRFQRRIERGAVIQGPAVTVSVKTGKVTYKKARVRW